MRAARALLLFALATASVAAEEPSYDLLWKPKPKDALDYKLTLVIDVQEYRFNFESDLLMKVLKVDENGDYELETSTKNSKISFQGEEEMVPEENDPTIEKYSSKGERLSQPDKKDDSGADEEDEDANPIGKVLSEVTNFIAPEKPVKKGDKWVRDVKGDEKAKVEAAKLEYEVVGKEREGDFEVIRVDYKYKQTEAREPVTAEGTFRIKKDDFSLVSFEATVEGFKMDPDAPTGTAKLKMKRV